MAVLLQIVTDYTGRVLGWGYQFTDHILDVVSNLTSGESRKQFNEWIFFTNIERRGVAMAQWCEDSPPTKVAQFNFVLCHIWVGFIALFA